MSRENDFREIGILGGAFNPITLGHVQIAEVVLARSPEMDAVWIMPCYTHLYRKQMVPGEQRLEMCRLAVGEKQNIFVSDYEFVIKNRGGTYDLMRRLLEEPFSRGVRYSLIIGQDNADTLHYWVHYKELLELVRFIVIPRKGIKRDESITWYTRPPHLYLEEEVMEVSSTLVRDHLSGEGKKFLHPGVWRYIREKGLYR